MIILKNIPKKYQIKSNIWIESDMFYSSQKEKKKMENITEDKIYKLVGLDKIKRSSMARYFGRITEAERIESVKIAYDLAKQYLWKVDEGMRGKPDFFYSLLCLSLWKLNWTRHDLAKKNPELTKDQAKEISERRLASLLSARNDRVKRGKLKVLIDVRLFHVVRELRGKGASWRECATYLKKYHKTQISHVHLYKLCRKITTERIKRGEE